MWISKVTKNINLLKFHSKLIQLVAKESSWSNRPFPSPYAEPSLEAVVLVMHHGIRAPAKTYPKDQCADNKWAGSLGSLLPLGEKQMEVSGKLKAKRYKAVLSMGSGYINAESSAYPPCEPSALKFLAGFLEDSRVTSKMLKVLPRSEDEYLNPRGKDCPKYINSFKAGLKFNEKDVQSFLDSIGWTDKVWRYIKENTGLPLLTTYHIFELDKILTIQQENRLALPQWAEPVYKKYIHPIGNFVFHKMAKSPYMRIRSGVLLQEIIDNFLMLMDGKCHRHITIYMAHDITISGLAHHLKIDQLCDEKPKYGACLAFELHYSPHTSDTYAVRMAYFKNYEDAYPAEMNLRDCPQPCSFEMFQHATQKNVVRDYKKVCGETGRQSISMSSPLA